MVSSFIKKQLEGHEVKFETAGSNALYFKVKSRSGKVYDQIVGKKILCTCNAGSNGNIMHGRICSHLRVVFLKMAETGRLDLEDGE